MHKFLGMYRMYVTNLNYNTEHSYSTPLIHDNN